jgi:hypothetical protein
MKQYKFEFDKFLKDLEERDKKHRQIIENSVEEKEDINYARQRVVRYREKAQNQIVYNQERSNVK